MNKEDKSQIIDEAADFLEKSSAVYVVDYSGINVEEIDSLRKQFRKEGVTYKVYKNTLFTRALKQAGKYEKLSENLPGMSGFVFAFDNPVAPAKIIKKFYEDNSKFNLKGCFIEDQYYDAKQLNQLAELPTKPEVIAGILGSLDSPVSGLVGALNAVIRDLVSVIDEVSKKKAA
ncbi:MAG: 50S ribosomal protein L10 [Ignavibacterium sp.]